MRRHVVSKRFRTAAIWMCYYYLLVLWRPQQYQYHGVSCTDLPTTTPPSSTPFSIKNKQQATVTTKIPTATTTAMEYESYEIPSYLLRSYGDFEIIRKLGSGKFSDVFEAIDLSRMTMTPSNNNNNNNSYNVNHKVVVKCLKPVTERKIKREILILTHAYNARNVVKLLGVCWPNNNNNSSSNNNNNDDDDDRMPSLVLEHAGPQSRWFCHGSGIDKSLTTSNTNTNTNNNNNTNNSSYFLTEVEIKYYLYQLLIALNDLHSRGIMHRDVKPRNVLITRTTNQRPQNHKLLFLQNKNDLLLVDLGLADFFVPNQKYNVRVASRHYKGPELLVGIQEYDYSLDLWGVGCILAGLMFRREPFFRGKDNVDQLVKIVDVLGTKDLVHYCQKYGVTLSSSILQAIHIHNNNHNNHNHNHLTERQDWNQYYNNKTPQMSQHAMDLLNRLLVYDHRQRITASQALLHPFFDEIR